MSTPNEIAKNARKIIEGMKGERLDEEIDDVMTDAIWEAFAAGKQSVGKPRKPKATPAPAERLCVCGHAESAHAVLSGHAGARHPACLILGGPSGGCRCEGFQAAPARAPGDDR